MYFFLNDVNQFLSYYLTKEIIHESIPKATKSILKNKQPGKTYAMSYFGIENVFKNTLPQYMDLHFK